jgi:hypothetical protein
VCGKPGIQGRIIIKLKKIMHEGMGRIQLAQDRVQWQAGVNMAMNFPVPLRVRNFSFS